MVRKPECDAQINYTEFVKKRQEVEFFPGAAKSDFTAKYIKDFILGRVGMVGRLFTFYRSILRHCGSAAGFGFAGNYRTICL
jgi:hypothetical protein